VSCGLCCKESQSPRFRACRPLSGLESDSSS
jgi:hypothetical protein